MGFLRNLCVVFVLLAGFCGGFALAQSAADSVMPADNDTASSVTLPDQTQGTRQDQRQGGNGQAQVARVKTYPVILKILKSEAAGDIVKVLLVQRQKNQWTYEFTVLDDAGHSTKVSIDANTAKVIAKKRL